MKNFIDDVIMWVLFFLIVVLGAVSFVAVLFLGAIVAIFEIMFGVFKK